MTSRLACRDDADEIPGSGIAIGVYDNQQNYSFRKADCEPSRFAVRGSLDERDKTWIVENQPRGLKIDTVLQEIASVLCLIPFEANHCVCTD